MQATIWKDCGKIKKMKGNITFGKCNPRRKDYDLDYNKDNLKLISHNKIMATKKTKYILKYDTSGADPYEEFVTLEEVKKRIDDLIASEDEGLILSSVRIYEVKSIAKVETKIVF